jgi:LDH2 family malate/lactate/ureidoglycolate dehydrogenase
VPLLTESQMRDLVREALVAAGLTAAEAGSCADASVFADLRGTTTHGIVYILRRTLESIRQGKTVSGSRPMVVKDRGAAALVKGAGVVGPVLGEWAMAMAVDKARSQGIGVVNTFNGNPIGLLGYYANLAADKAMIGLCMANTAPSAAPFGGTTAVLGTNPFAYAAPSRGGRAILFDIASTVASAGKLQRAKRRGETLPADWVIGRDGKPITDPASADGGAMLPFGGHKGSGIAILIHLLTGGLSETTIGGDPTHDNPDPDKRGQGALFAAIDPDAFGTAGGFAAMVERQIGFVHGAAPLPGKGAPLYPGERGWTELDTRTKNGIPVPDEDWEVVLKAIRASRLPERELLARVGL